MISNPNNPLGASSMDEIKALNIIREPDEDKPDTTERVGHIRVRKAGITLPDFDQVIESTFGYIDSKIVNVDAKIFEGKRNNKKLVHYRSLREFASSPTFKKRVHEVIKLSEIKELRERMREMVETDSPQAREALVSLREASGNSFDLGLYPDEMSSLPGSGRSFIPLENIILPSTTSPYAKQMLFVDYLDMHRKSFEAATRNPLGKRICRLIPQFVLGRSLLFTVNKAPKYQDEWDAFWKYNRMKLRIKTIFRELLIYGEVFLRYFRLPPNEPGGLAIRSLDPSTIWDIITNPDDLEDVYYYHQQYVISQYSGPVMALQDRRLPPATLVIRQIPAEDIDHFKINSTSSEKRGRSELFAILGYLARFRQFVDDRMLLNKMRSMFAVDVSVDGQQRDVDAAESQFANPPGTGSVMIHNKNVEVDFKSAQAADSVSAQSDADLFLKIIAVGAGVSQSFLGVGGTEGTRAGALIQTEPDVKNFEDYQEMVQQMIEEAAERVFIDARMRRNLSVPPKDMVIGATFPSIAQEDRSAKLKDIGFSESMGWFSKRRSANMAADEFKQNDYDYDTEQDTIKKETEENPIIANAMAQAPKGEENIIQKDQGNGPDATKQIGNTTGEKDALKSPGGQTGGVIRSDATRAIPDKKKSTDLRQGGLDRKKEKKRIRASGSDPSIPRGWSTAAREASIEARRRKTLLKRGQAEPSGDQAAEAQ